MAKNKQSSQMFSSGWVVVAGIILLAVGRYLGDWNNTIFGYWPAVEIRESLHWISGFLSGMFGIYLILERRNMNHTKLLAALGFMLAVFAFMFGWALTSVAIQPMHIHSDGYSVTGGFLMFLSGLYIGYIAKKGVDNGKK